MKRLVLIVFILVSFGLPLQAKKPGFDLGLRYGAGICSLGQDPFMERTADYYTFLNFVIAGELIVEDIFRIEMDLLFDERGFSKIGGDKTTHVLYFLEVPFIFKLYPIKYIYIGTGFGFAFKVGAKDIPWYKDLTGTLMGYDNFVSEKMKDFEVNHVLVLGASIPVYQNVTVVAEFRHNYGLTSINGHHNKSVLLPPKDFTERFRTLYFFIGASYRVL
jgi:hypothetical protein